MFWFFIRECFKNLRFSFKFFKDILWVFFCKVFVIYYFFYYLGYFLFVLFRFIILFFFVFFFVLNKMFLFFLGFFKFIFWLVFYFFFYLALVVCLSIVLFWLVVFLPGYICCWIFFLVKWSLLRIFILHFEAIKGFFFDIYFLFFQLYLFFIDCFRFFKCVGRYLVKFKFFFKKASFLRSFCFLYKLIKFLFFCFFYRYVFGFRKIYIYFVWRFLPLDKTVTAIFADWVSRHWDSFQGLVDLVFSFEWFYKFFVRVYIYFFYNPLNFLLLFIQNFLIKLISKLDKSVLGMRFVGFLQKLYLFFAKFYSFFFKYMRKDKVFFLGSKEVRVDNPTFFLWRLFYGICRFVIIVFVTFFWLVERFFVLLYNYILHWSVIAFMAKKYWQKYKTELVKPILALEDMQPIVSFFSVKRRRKHNRYLISWLFYLFIYLFILVVYVLIGIFFILWKVRVLIWYNFWQFFSFLYSVISKFFRFYLVRFFLSLVFWEFWSIAFFKLSNFFFKIWHFIIMFFFYWFDFSIKGISGNFVSLVIFFFLYWQDFKQSIFNFFWHRIWSIVRMGFLSFWAFLRILFGYYFSKVFFKHLLKVAFNGLRSKIWYVYMHLYFYILGWHSYFDMSNPLVQSFIYRDYYFLWNLKSNVLSNIVNIIYLRYFFWVQLDTIYRASYIFHEFLYSYGLRNLIRYRSSFVGFRSYLWFWVNFFVFFFYFYFYSIWNVSLGSLFFCYLDIFQTFTVRKLFLNYLLEYWKVSLYRFNEKYFVRVRKIVYWKSFDFGLINWLQGVFKGIFSGLENSNNVYLLVLYCLSYVYKLNVERLVKILRDLFFVDNSTLYLFFRFVLWFTNMSGRIDLFVRYKHWEYSDLVTRNTLWSKINVSLNKLTAVFARGLRGKEVVEQREGDNVLGGEERVGKTLDQFRVSTEAGSSDEAMIREIHVEDVSYVKIFINYLRYVFFLFFVALPWYILEFFLYIIFDLFFVFFFFYVYMCVRIFSLIFVGFVFSLFFLVIFIFKKFLRLLKIFFKRVYNLAKELY